MSHPQRHPDAHGHSPAAPLGHACAPERGAGFHVCAAPRTWRLAAAVPQDPFMCLTLKTDPIRRECPDQPASFSGRTAKPRIGQKYPHSISSSTPSVVMPCFPCAVGIDVGGTGMGPVVSSVLNLPSIVRPSGPWRGLPTSSTFRSRRRRRWQIWYLPSTLRQACASGSSQSVDHLVCAPTPDGQRCGRPGPVLAARGRPRGPAQEAAGTPDVCTDAAGLLVAPCLAKTGGLSFVDASSTDVANLCTRFRPGQNISVVSAGGGRGAVIDCVRCSAAETPGWAPALFRQSGSWPRSLALRTTTCWCRQIRRASPASLISRESTTAT